MRLPVKLKNATPEVTDRFQDGRRRHYENSSECYKLGNYHPILLKIGTPTKKIMLSSKKYRKCRPSFKMAAAAILLNSSECYKMGNYHPILMKLAHRLRKAC
jgi:hypothetical protein